VYLAFSMDEEFDRLDCFSEIAKQWPRLRARYLPVILMHLLPRSWYRPNEELKEELLALAEKSMEEPANWLRYLDIFREEAPTVLAAFVRYLNQQEYMLTE